MDEKKNAVKLFLQQSSANFVLAVMAMTLAGLLMGSAGGEEGLFRLGEGLAFEGLIQIFLWSCIISGLMTVLTSDIWFRKIMLLWRVVALMLLAVAVSAGFVIVFRWFPIDAWEAWATFLGIFILCFGGGLVTMVAKTKIEDSRYNKLLSEYKMQRGRTNND